MSGQVRVQVGVGVGGVGDPFQLELCLDLQNSENVKSE